jgi:hypothetical protein
MTLRPEQVKTREYLHQKGTLLPAAQIHERVAAAFTAVEALLDGISEAEARQRALPGEWTIQEVVDHLIESHRPGLDELRDLLENRRPPGAPIPAALQSADPMSRPWPERVIDLKALHAQILGLLASCPDRMTDARAPVILVVTVKEADGRDAPLQWVEELDWKAYAVIFRLHALDHLAQVRKILKAARSA